MFGPLKGRFLGSAEVAAGLSNLFDWMNAGEGRFLCTGAEDLASSGSRAALGIFGCSGWCSGVLPELILGSPRVILELMGAHFGFSEGHF